MAMSKLARIVSKAFTINSMARFALLLHSQWGLIFIMQIKQTEIPPKVQDFTAFHSGLFCLFPAHGEL